MGNSRSYAKFTQDNLWKPAGSSNAPRFKWATYPLTLFALLLCIALPAKAEEAPGAFITRLADTAISTLTRPDMPDDVRTQEFRTLLTEGFALERISNFLLGPYRRKASPGEIADFRAALEDNIVATYSWRFKSYAGQTISVVGVRDGRREQKIVTTRFDAADGKAPIKVDWRLVPNNETWQIFDVIVEGLSMAVAQRDEYASVIRSNDGEVGALVGLMQKQTQKLIARK